jgi:glycosyltransferase involved in cell wall biosynthesis
MKEPLVSIITPTYNSGKYIKQTIESIQAQTFNNWELLITDDNSTDNTIEIIKSIQKEDGRIKLFIQSFNQGAGVARNNSISKANLRFIAFCDSDDLWLPTKLEKQLNFILSNKISFCYTSYSVINDNLKIINKIKSPSKLTYELLLKNNYILCSTVIYDQNILGKIFMPEIRFRQDWGMWLIIFKKIKVSYGINENLAFYRKRANSISSNKIKMIKYNWLVYHEILNFNKLRSSLFLIKFLFFYLKKIYGCQTKIN